MSGHTKYRAFISYSHDDSRWARRIHRALEAYRLPGNLIGIKTEQGLVPKRLNPIFRDRDDLPAAGDLTASVRTALAQSDVLIVVCSPAAAASGMVMAASLLPCLRLVCRNLRLSLSVRISGAMAMVSGWAWSSWLRVCWACGLTRSFSATFSVANNA